MGNSQPKWNLETFSLGTRMLNFALIHSFKIKNKIEVNFCGGLKRGYGNLLAGEQNSNHKANIVYNFYVDAFLQTVRMSLLALSWHTLSLSSKTVNSVGVELCSDRITTL